MPLWDDRTFYGFVATSRAFASRSFRHREIFGQVGFGTGGWDTDFPNSMLEILRVVYTDSDERQRLHRRRRRAAAAPAVAPRGRADGALAARARRWRRCTTARRARASRASRRRAGRVRDHRPLGRHAHVPGRAVHLPVLAAHHPHRLRRLAVLATPLDGDRSHPLHGVGQDLRPGRPAVLARPRPGDRPRTG